MASLTRLASTAVINNGMQLYNLLTTKVTLLTPLVKRWINNQANPPVNMRTPMTSFANSGKSLIDVINDDGLRTGEVLSREEIHTQGKVHRAVHLYLFDKSNNLLLQRRVPNADHFPNMFSISLTGHIDAGEGSQEALSRELKEELGLDASKMKIEFLFSFKRCATVTPTYIDHQFNDVYACWDDFNVQQIKFDPEEVSELKLVPFAEFQKMVTSSDSKLAPVYTEECKDVVYFLRSRLS